MTEEVDLILGMMLSNRCPKTRLCNQTVGGENGSCGKTVVLGACWRRSRAECPHAPVVFVVVCSPVAAAVRTLLLFSHARLFLPPPLLLRLPVQIDRTGRPLVRRRHNHGLVQTRYARHKHCTSTSPRFRFKYGVSVLIKRSKIVLDDLDVPGSP